MKQLPATSRIPCHRERIATTLATGSAIIPALKGGFARKSQVACWVAVLFGFLQVAGHAAIVTVANTNNAGAGSLREAIATASAADTIDFAPALSGQTITLTSELVLNTSLTIDASGLAGGLTLGGSGAQRLLRVNVSQNVTLRGLTFTGGNGTGAEDNAYGGAIYTAGTTAVESCTFSGNSATLYGGAISNSGILTVNGCTFSGNTAGFEGGGIYSDFASTLVVNNSTFTGNSASFYGGAIFNGTERKMTLSSATLVGNTAIRTGGGIYNDFLGTPSSTINNSIIAGNTAPEGENVFGPADGTNNLTSGDPKLSPLGNFGGPTQTMPPLPDSPALDAGGTTSLLIDQRGQPRILRTALDIGAYESPVSDYNPVGLTIYAKADPGDSGYFEISTDPEFLPVVSTLAGTGVDGFVEGTRLAAQLSYPSGVAQDSLGNTFFADTGNHRIRMFAPDGIVVTIAGTGVYGLANGSGPTAQFAFPSALTVGPDDNVYVADTYNHRICKLTRPAIPGGAWTVTNLAGTGIAGFVEGAGSVARFNYPYGLSLASNERP
jgi:predicted outer membrane repeat protein